jgi:S1/P1 nuclease
MRTVVATLWAFWVLAVAPLGSALAWNDTGHQVVALIAWDHLSEATREKVVALMAQSTSEPLTALLPQDGRPLAVRRREFFVRASTWADLIRGTADDRPTWHHRSFFWKQVNGQAVDVTDVEVNEQNVIERLAAIEGILREGSRPIPERAMFTAWLLHLAGDIHQPLHCASRVTAEEPHGDRGGNSFLLDLRPDGEPNKLHAYWDGLLDQAFPRRPQENGSAYLRRLANIVKTAHPRNTMAGVLKLGKFEDWARESLAEAKHAYPPSLERNQAPAPAYRIAGGKVALKRVALGGYRLAATLEELLGQ